MATELVTLRDRTDRTKMLHPETEAAAVLTNTPGKTLDKALSSGVSYTEGSTGGVSTDNLSGYYSKTQVDELLEKKEDKPSKGSFPIYLDLSGEADYQIYQGNVPGHNWTWNSLSLLTTWNGLAGSFKQGAQVAEVGKSYLALFGRGSSLKGLSAAVFTVGSDGSSITWDETKRWDLQVGCEVVMPNGSIYKVIKAPSAASFPIYKAVKPIAGRIPLEISGSSANTYFSNVSDISVRFKILGMSSNTWKAQLFVNGCKDCDYCIDCSALTVNDKDQSMLFLYLDGDNAQIPAGSQFLGAVNYTTGSNGIQQLRINRGSWNDGTTYVQNIPFADVPTILRTTVPRFYLAFLARDPKEKFDDGSRIRKDLLISLTGHQATITRPIVYEDASEATTLAAVPMMTSLADTPVMSEGKFEKAIEGKQGIFVEKDGRPFDLIMNEYAD